jgi:AGZA family xanthine/uracil permease-like MFS transporter
MILVGYMMMTALTEAEDDAEGKQDGLKLAGIDFTDFGIGLAAALTIMFMPFTFSITDGIGIGFSRSSTSGRHRAAARGAFVHVDRFVRVLLYFLVPFLQDTFDWI